MWLLSCVCTFKQNHILWDVNMPKLTKTVVEALPAAKSGPVFVWDDRISGFGLKVLPSGSRKYIFKYRTNGGRSGKQRWLSLGAHGAITADQARGLAQQASAAVARGEDPQAAKSSASNIVPTLLDAWTRFQTDYLPLKKATTQNDYTAAWTSIIEPKLGKCAIIDIDTQAVERLHKSMRHRPYRANRMLSLLSRLFNLAERWGWNTFGANPCRNVDKFAEKARQRFLSKSEIAKVRMALDDLEGESSITHSAANTLRILLFTGARLREVTTARWAWVDWEHKVLALPDSKTGPKQVYLSEPALSVLHRQKALCLNSEYIFPSRSINKPIINLRKPWLRVCGQAGLEGVRIHDLRHTAASVAIGAGASLAIVGKLLGHTQAQTTLRYAHLDADPALKAANLVGEAIVGTNQD